ncbi:MAG: DNA mismatch repair endonuclease MutL [Christensenellaceae bacterium]|jgi:DNA mismatch repair protein MutL|nr:DNA mismatch repair endonuclease MutL [Christensenellaceae bacterium]
MENTPGSRHIRLLDEQTINRIAAGEVVERPASIAKELLENSIDAGATAITLEIREGGIDYLRVTDNGSGIPAEEVRMAFERHATSKISSGDALTSIGTLGFRGEALPSIASVAKVELTTRTAGAEGGTRIEIAGGHVEGLRAAGSPQGTTLVMRDLFFNTPARKKFLKRPSVEGGLVAEVAAHTALARPEIALRFINNGKTIYQTTGNGDLKTVIYLLHGKETASELIPVDGSFSTVRCKGFVGVGNAARATRAYQFFFLNGRYIRSPLLSAALEAAASERVMIGKTPYCVLHIELPPECVDVNAHPNKLEVRFRDGYPIQDNLREILLTAFPRPQPFAPQPPDGEAARFVHLKQEQQPLRPVKPQDEAPFSPSAAPFAGFREGISALMPSSAPIWMGEGPADPPPATERPANPPKPEFFGPLPILIGQLFDTYLLAQLGEEFILIDQHAAHERILYERFKAALGREGLSQPLLSPYIFHVTPKEEALLLENLAHLEGLGFQLEAFGPSQYRVLSLPMLLGQPAVPGFIQQLLDHIEDVSNLREEDLKRETLIQMACHGAIKAGDRLSYEELRALMQSIRGENIPLTCPHGRPVLLRMTKRELERKFKRIQ